MTEIKGFKDLETLVLVLKRQKVKIKQSFYSKSKAEVIIDQSDIDDVFQSIYTTVVTSRQKFLTKGSNCIFWLSHGSYY